MQTFFAAFGHAKSPPCSGPACISGNQIKIVQRARKRLVVQSCSEVGAGTARRPALFRVFAEQVGDLGDRDERLRVDVVDDRAHPGDLEAVDDEVFHLAQ